MLSFISLLTLVSAVLAGPLHKYDGSGPVVNRTTCDGHTYSYRGLEGYGFLPASFRDKFGDTVSTGSSIAVSNWKAVRDSYKATLYALPDRGWNTNGTTAYQPRVHRYSVTFTPAAAYPSPPNFALSYETSILLTDPAGVPVSGLDPTGTLCYPGDLCIPAASFPGDGFGGAGPGGKRGSLDPEGLVVASDGTFWISDEYGPYLYHFSSSGRMLHAVAPPNSLLPIRDGKVNFASNNPPIYDPSQIPQPANPTSGRANNQGFEGLTYVAKEHALYTMLQSGSINNGGEDKSTNRYTTLLKYSLDSKRWVGEWTVPLPQFQDPTKKPTAKPRTAASSEIHALGSGRFLSLSRDGFGRLGDRTQSVYRHADVFSINSATDILGKFDDFTSSFAPAGVLDPSVTPAEYCQFLDFNVPTELAKFGLLNGGAVDSDQLMNEKWEGLALVPVAGKKREFWLIASSDNDFITQDGWFNFGRDSYKDASGGNLLNQFLVFRVSLH
ncbi:phytase-like domain-containing protein [Sphaerosporella brunnea]|uniref:Phytase-like domain-containing protein n=1 Tax=Sphaerosporella brunnea TaxID=1250544 RepID=A0A5J5F6L1_9PEZI|nr:phytase-like domain-containing protein [Sphaerosporella brunnea]